MKRNRFRIFALLVGGPVLAFSVYRLWFLWRQPEGSQWTPQHLALRLDTVSDRFEVLVARSPLGKTLSEGRIYLADERSRSFPLTESDVTVRVNSYDRIRASYVPSFLWLGVTAGAAGMLFLLGLFAPALGTASTSGLTELHLLHQT